jgi:hypothetical protein
MADIAVSIPVGLLAFYTASRVMKIPELDPAFGALAAPVLRRFRRRT